MEAYENTDIDVMDKARLIGWTKTKSNLPKIIIMIPGHFKNLKSNIILDLYRIFDCFLPRIHSEYYLNKTINETHLLPDILGIILFILSQTKAI